MTLLDTNHLRKYYEIVKARSIIDPCSKCNLRFCPDNCDLDVMSDYKPLLYCPAKSRRVSEYTCANCNIMSSYCAYELIGLFEDDEDDNTT